MDFGFLLYATLVCTIIGWFGYGMHQFGITSPVIAGPLVGLLLGDFQKGVEIGAQVTLIHLGVVAVGAAIPINQTTATTVATALSIITGADTSAAIALTIPVGILGQLDRMVAWTLNSTVMHVADRYAENDELKKMARLSYLGSFIFFVAELIPVALCIFLGSPFVEYLNTNMPQVITTWLNLATGMLPALGFGMLFTMMYKKQYIPYFIIGFVVAAYFQGNLQSVALFGLAAALLHYFGSVKEGA